MAVRALIFDFDGLIVDTESPAFECWQPIFAEYGHELSFDVWKDSLGTHNDFDPISHLIELLRQRRAFFLAEEVGLRRRELGMQYQVSKDEASYRQPILPGVRELMEAAPQYQLRCGVASSSSSRWVGGWLQRLKLTSYLHAFATSDMVSRVKPDPELYLLAAQQLGLAPQECVAIEDSPNGALAAQRAGMRVVVVPGAISARLPLPPADLVLPRLDAMPLDELLARLD